MLILTRKTNEKLIIGSDVVIEIVRVRGQQVSIGITAPSHVPVHREEIFNKIKTETKTA